MRTWMPIAILGAAIFPAGALAQFAIDWYTIDGGAGASTGGGFALTGTIGQPDAGPSQSGGSFAVTGGFIPGLGPPPPPPCYADCTSDGALTVADFGCFQGRYVLGDLYADCTGEGTLTVADFGCFQGKYVLGCS